MVKSIPWVATGVASPASWFNILWSDKAGTLRLRHGLRLTVDGKNSLSFVRQIFHRKIYGQLSGQERTILDIGSNMGTYAIYAAQNSHPDCQIYAFEPHPNSFNLVKKNIADNGFEQKINAINAAVVGDDKGRQLYKLADSLCSNLFDFGSESNGTRIETTSLPTIMAHYNLPQIDLLKMNCEGAEYEILMSLSPDLLRKIKEIRMEYHQFTHGSKRYELGDLTDFLTANGFSRTTYLPFHPKHGIVWFIQNKQEIGPI